MTNDSTNEPRPSDSPAPVSPSPSLGVLRPAAECHWTIDRMASYLGRDLGGDDRERFVAHLRGCSNCHEKLLALELFLSLADWPPPTEGRDRTAS